MPNKERRPIPGATTALLIGIWVTAMSIELRFSPSIAFQTWLWSLTVAYLAYCMADNAIVRKARRRGGKNMGDVSDQNEVAGAYISFVVFWVFQGLAVLPVVVPKI